MTVVKNTQWWLLCLLVAIGIPEWGLAGSYELVRGKGSQLCRDLTNNLNEFESAPPMACGLRFSSRYKNFSRPVWRVLPTEQAVSAAIAIERVSINRQLSNYSILLDQEAKEIRAVAGNGKLKVREAIFDIARSGTPQRVVLATRMACEQWTEKWANPGEPRIGVLLGNGFEVDERYERFSTLNGDVFFYEGIPYLSSWETFPGAIERGPAPAKKHRAYVFVWDVFWLQHETGTYQKGVAGFRGPVCQIGWQRIKVMKGHANQRRGPERQGRGLHALTDGARKRRRFHASPPNGFPRPRESRTIEALHCPRDRHA